MELVIATNNPSKFEQIKPFFAGLPLTILSLTEAGVRGEAVEDGTTLEENAVKKALFALEQTKKASVADDTGFFIDALDGKPGIHAARWAGEGKTTEEIMRHTLDILKEVPLAKRTATFRTVAVLILPGGSIHKFVGEVKGVVQPHPIVPPQPKMPYSGIFLPHGQMKVWAQMSTAEENAISHRGKAFGQLRTFLRGHLL